MINQYIKQEQFNEFISVSKQNNFKMINLNTYVMQTAGQINSSVFDKCSVSFDKNDRIINN